MVNIPHSCAPSACGSWARRWSHTGGSTRHISTWKRCPSIYLSIYGVGVDNHCPSYNIQCDSDPFLLPLFAIFSASLDSYWLMAWAISQIAGVVWYKKKHVLYAILLVYKRYLDISYIPFNTVHGADVLFEWVLLCVDVAALITFVKEILVHSLTADEGELYWKYEWKKLIYLLSKTPCILLQYIHIIWIVSMSVLFHKMTCGCALKFISIFLSALYEEKVNSLQLLKSLLVH